MKIRSLAVVLGLAALTTVSVCAKSDDITSPAAHFTEFAVPSTARSPFGITRGPDGNLWFAALDAFASAIGKMTTNGDFTIYPLAIGAGAAGIVSAPDNGVWFTEYYGQKIGRCTVDGIITEWTLPSGGGAYYITVGPDQALWFTDYGANEIGRITLAGNITEFPLPVPSSEPLGITAGPDGALWFSEYEGHGNGRIGRCTVDGVITEFAVVSPADPIGIVRGADGALWYTNDGGTYQLGRLTTSGAVTIYPIPGEFAYGEIINGPGVDFWFTQTRVDGTSKIGRMSTARVYHSYLIPTAHASSNHITRGPDGALWFTETAANKIGRLGP